MDAPDLSRMKAVTVLPRRWCQHCRVRVQSCARRLCKACFSLPGVRDLYPPPLVRQPHATCTRCDAWIAYSVPEDQRAGIVCVTCKLDKPHRERQQAALVEFERRAAEELPLFDAIRETGVVY